jgi:hypothetical protein
MPDESQIQIEDIRVNMTRDQRTAAAKAIGRALRGEEPPAPPETREQKITRLTRELAELQKPEPKAE